MRKLPIAIGCASAAAIACTLMVDTGGLSEPDTDASTPDASDDETNDGETSDASDASDAGIDAPKDPCPMLGGAQADAAWPMLGGCPTHAGRSVFTGAGPGLRWTSQPDAGLVTFSSPIVSS